MDCLGFVEGGTGYGPRIAGPERDMRILELEEKTAGFFMVDGIGICERAFPYASGGGIAERRRSDIAETRGYEKKVKSQCDERGLSRSIFDAQHARDD